MAQAKRSRAKSGKAGQRRRHKPGLYVPITEQFRICEDYLKGGPDNSIRKLALKYRRAEETIAKIVHSEEMSIIVEKVKQRLSHSISEQIADRIQHEVADHDTKDGAWIAMDLAERLGLIPPKIEKEPPLSQAGLVIPERESTREERVEDIVMALTRITLERAKVFGMPMPELDEMNGKHVIDIPVGVRKEQVE